MGRGTRIAIIHHADRGVDGHSYFIRMLRREWEAAGHTVVVVDDPRRFQPADVAVAHIDLTRIPERWQDLLRRYPRVVNGRLTDISKSAVSPLTVREGDGWDGPVIVKTEANCAGLPEISERAQRLGLGFRPLTSRLKRFLRRRAPLDPDGLYPTFDRIGDVPPELLRDPRLVVQRFLPERDGDLFVLRLLTFFGHCGVSIVVRSQNKVVKSRGMVDAKIDVAPPGLLEEVRKLGADYGKVDFVLHDGHPVIFDVNRTPTYAGVEPNERHLFVAKTIAPGIEEWLG